MASNRTRSGAGSRRRHRFFEGGGPDQVWRFGKGGPLFTVHDSPEPGKLPRKRPSETHRPSAKRPVNEPGRRGGRATGPIQRACPRQFVDGRLRPSSPLTVWPTGSKKPWIGDIYQSQSCSLEGTIATYIRKTRCGERNPRPTKPVSGLAGRGSERGEATGSRKIDIRTPTDAIATPRVGGGTDRVTGWKTAPPTERVRHRAGTRRNGRLTKSTPRSDRETPRSPRTRSSRRGEMGQTSKERERGGRGEERPRSKRPASLVSHDCRRTAPERKDLPAPFSTLDPNVETPSAAAEIV